MQGTIGDLRRRWGRFQGEVRQEQDERARQIEAGAKSDAGTALMWAITIMAVAALIWWPDSISRDATRLVISVGFFALTIIYGVVSHLSYRSRGGPQRPAYDLRSALVQIPAVLAIIGLLAVLPGDGEDEFPVAGLIGGLIGLGIAAMIAWDRYRDRDRAAE